MVLQSSETRITGTAEDFQAFVKKHARMRREGGSWHLSGYKWSLPGQQQLDLRSYWPDRLGHFSPLFNLRMPTDTRLSGSNPASAIDMQREAYSHPIHILFDDDKLEIKISDHFRTAFGNDLIIDHFAGQSIPLLVGDRPVPAVEEGEDRLSKTYREKTRDSTIPLLEQGDGMRSFASVILHMLAPISASILLLDEPEAFLHPPQARFLGEIIATEKPSRAQLFVATHSPDVLHGLLNVAPDRLRLLRMQRDGDVNRIKELDKELVKKISVDPLMNYSSVLSGVFHERVIICEADGDCMFYSSILDLSDVHGEGNPDVLFIHAGGKDRMATLAATLTALDVPVDVVADIDVLRDEGGLKKIIDALGGDWSKINPAANVVRTAIEESIPGISLDQIKDGIRSVLDEEEQSDASERQLHSRINAVFNKASPWDFVKRAGVSSLPQGQATERFQELQTLCEETGLWIVPVGQLEGFCKSIPLRGPRWVQGVIDNRDLVSDPELGPARKFVREVWEGKHKYNAQSLTPDSS